jgi:hypothetical protein
MRSRARSFDPNTFQYTIGFVPAGDYVVAYTCDSDSSDVDANAPDDPAGADEVVEFTPAAGTAVTVSTDATVGRELRRTDALKPLRFRAVAGQRPRRRIVVADFMLNEASTMAAKARMDRLSPHFRHDHLRRPRMRASGGRARTPDGDGKISRARPRRRRTVRRALSETRQGRRRLRHQRRDAGGAPAMARQRRGELLEQFRRPIPTATARWTSPRSRSRFPKLAENFAKIDTDNDGRFTAQEIRAARPH